jgi:hypothetical protein
MRFGPAQHGDVMQFERPEWRPLTTLLGEHLAECFMWMHEIRLADGTAIHAYKHARTRRYLHLAFDGRAFVYLGAAYLRIETRLAVMRVVPQRESPARSTSVAPC